MILLTRKEACVYLKISMRTLDKIINDRNFDGKIKIGRRTLIKQQSLDKFVEKNIV